MKRPAWFSYARLNLALAVAWALVLPASLIFGFWRSVAFVSLASIYANVATHFAGWRADQEDVE